MCSTGLTNFYIDFQLSLIILLSEGASLGLSAKKRKNLPATQEMQVLIPRSGRSPGGENGNPLQDSCLENPKDGGAWWAIAQQGHQ